MKNRVATAFNTNCKQPLGIAIFLFLGVWLIITLLCMLLGWFLGRRLPFSWGKWFGLFLGFMLPTGYYLVSWTAEYFMMQDAGRYQKLYQPGSLSANDW